MIILYRRLRTNWVQVIRVVKKVLFCATVDDHFESFHLPYMKWFKDLGWEVHVAAKGRLRLDHVDKKFNLPLERSPVSIKNIEAYKEIKKIIDSNHYDIVHCHTPVGGAIARLASHRARKCGTKVIYTAHGFHFYKGAPLVNWLIYYPIERLLACSTDCLITINKEDYRIATNHSFSSCHIDHVHGVGVDTEKFKPAAEHQKNDLRKKHGYSAEQFILIYAAELNKNKNQYLVIEAVANIKGCIPHIKLLLAGSGSLEEEYRLFAAKKGVTNEVDFLGYRADVDELLKLSDAAVASSLREGLPINVAEAMACGLPLVVSDNRGHRELVTDGVNGYIIKNNNHLLFSEKLYTMYKSPRLRFKMGRESLNIVERYKLSKVSEEMSQIYRRYMLP